MNGIQELFRKILMNAVTDGFVPHSLKYRNEFIGQQKKIIKKKKKYFEKKKTMKHSYNERNKVRNDFAHSKVREKKVESSLFYCTNYVQT